MSTSIGWPWCAAWILGACTASAALPNAASRASRLTMDQVLADSKPEDWRAPSPEDTLYLDLPAGRVVVELAPQFAPSHVANIRALVRQHSFDALPITRVQDNYVVQWGDTEAKPPSTTLPPEFTRALAGLTFRPLPDPDAYALETGFVAGFPAARDVARGEAWPVHCYGMLGVGRDLAADSGSGSQLYVVIGHAPRHLDRNITLAGRVLVGMDLLSSLPRGHGPMGMQLSSELQTAITRAQLAADVPEHERMKIELLRTDRPAFDALIESRRNRTEEWFKVPAGRIDVCNVPLPVRVAP